MAMEEHWQADLMAGEGTRRSPDSVLAEPEPVLEGTISDLAKSRQIEVSGTVQKEIRKGRELALANKRHTEDQKRALPSVGAFTVQCSLCFKWRLIPTKEQYEEIRHRIVEEPWTCHRAANWRPNASCKDPPDVSQDNTRVWAIDRPNIPRPPSGWNRLTVIRGAGSSKFADIYYVEPSGKKLRSMPDVERFLVQHPEHTKAGVTLDQFSFMSPVPLDKHYIKKPQSKIMKSKNSMVDPGRLFQPISAKQRAERADARRKMLAELLTGGQSKSHQFERIDIPDETTRSLAIVPAQSPGCLPTAEFLTDQGECACPSGFEVSRNVKPEFSGDSMTVQQKRLENDPVSASPLASKHVDLGYIKSEKDVYRLH